MVLFGNGGKKARWLGTALLLVTFITGALAGAAAFRVLGAEKPEAREPGRERSASMRGGPRRLLLDDAFAKEIGLTGEQSTQIRAILDRRDAEAKKLWQGFEPQLKQLGKEVHDEIEKVLTAEQQQKLDAALEQKRAERKKHECRDSASHTKDTKDTKVR